MKLVMNNGVKAIGDDIDRTYGGKKLPPSYNWKKDPKGISNNGHITPNRCYHCGHRFVGAKLAAFCVVCDTIMTTDVDLKRIELVQTRIRIPDDVVDEKAYAEKMKIPEIKIGGFFRADQLV